MFEFQSKIIDANNAVFAAQEERSSMLERIRELEKQVADFEEWKTKKEKYELKAVMPSAFAYMLKPEARGTAPPRRAGLPGGDARAVIWPCRPRLQRG